MKSFKISLLAIILIASSFSAIAHESKLGQLIIDHPIARETPPGVKVGAGYLTITNNGKEDDTLISITADVSPLIQIHTVSIENNVMKMQQIKNGLTILAGKSVQLQAGGDHIMFMNLPQQLKEGEKHKAVLTFEKAGKVEITFNVEKHKVDKHKNHGNNKDAEKIKHTGHELKTKTHTHK